MRNGSEWVEWVGWVKAGEEGGYYGKNDVHFCFGLVEEGGVTFTHGAEAPFPLFAKETKS